MEIPGYMQDYLATISSVDDNVGRVLDYLEETGLDKNPCSLHFRSRILSW